MNKQEVIEKIKNIDAVESFMSETIWVKRNDVLALAYQLDEPEKPVLTEEEAEWVEGLKEEQERRPFWTKYSTLYFITRCGFGYGFSYDHKGREIELKHYPHEIHAEKERLANAILYGYEIEKEKLYEVFLKRTGAQLGVCVPHGEDKTQFTKVELQEYGFDNLDEYEVEEVEE
ncbi:DUF1642 domain-containing protein [Streptococcus equinus]|uniref:DUF1642 domain-containing protein n=1 Tax=Streptococcus equinus TaxID=1335 RepID=UPI0008CCB831|nr:DUF1642 domain-containing protein [Streptococcus equinus]QBX15899.1 hypothetical protein Javan221_0041 [Streptococcus phage Javan221]SEI64376.1 Protein of unknown function [Streptococcus equinus]